MRLRLIAKNRWNLVYIDDKPALCRKFRIEGFKEAQKALNSVIKVADEMNHHPHSITMKGDSIEFILMTHDKKNDLTKDKELSNKIDEIFNLLP